MANEKEYLMEFDPNNRIVQKCARGMELEGEGKHDEAAAVFSEAWKLAESDLEKFTAAHYVARHQETVEQKLQWDLLALKHAELLEDVSVRSLFPSLHLNIAKCYEDLEKVDSARAHYQLARSFCTYLPEDGYGNFIRRGVENGLQRLNAI